LWIEYSIQEFLYTAALQIPCVIINREIPGRVITLQELQSVEANKLTGSYVNLTCTTTELILPIVLVMLKLRVLVITSPEMEAETREEDNPNRP